MTNNQLKDEQIAQWLSTACMVIGDRFATVDELSAANAIRSLGKAEQGSEPVAWTWQHLDQWHVTNDEERARDLAWDGVKVMPLYRHAQPAPERDQVRCEHAEWSHATFGNVGPIGPLKHLSKEALEAAAEPGDLSEWADMQFLLWDAQRRAGITDEQITQAMIEKLAVNKLREWPEPKDGEPRLHIKEQPAPVVPDEMLCEFYEVDSWPDLVRELVKHVEQLQDSAKRNVKPWEDTFPETLLPAYIERIKQADEACRAAMLLAGNSPVIPDGYVMVPMRLTAENGAKAALLGEFNLEYSLTCHECFGEGCDDCSGEGTWTNTIPIDWTTIKEIWAKGVEHFVAAPPAPKQENI